jgi:Zn-dependent protease
MMYFLACVVVFCASLSMWALGAGHEFWSVFWALLAVVNTVSCKLNMKPRAGEPE